ncbi:MAG: response regulator [Litorimonas sp.]
MKDDATQSERPTVLVVEDDAFVALDVNDLLEAAGFEVIGCHGTPDSALALLAERTPDMAVLDFNLRRETSAEISQRLSELGVPFLYLSGRSRDTIGTDRPLLRKPFDPDALVRAVQALSRPTD